MISLFRSPQVPAPVEINRPRLDLSGPLLTRAFESLVAGSEKQGGVEYWIAIRLEVV